MTTPSTSEPLEPAVLADLEQWTRLSGWSRQHVRSIERHWRALGEPRPFRVIDVGCGLGGLLEDLLAWGEKLDVPLVLAGIDRYDANIDRARERLGRSAMLARGDLVHLGCEPQAWHLATATLLMNQLSGPDRLRLIAELSRAATTAYVFDVTPTVGGEVGARLIPWLTGLREAPPQAWIRTLERAPTLQEMVDLVAPLPVQVVRVFPSAVCTVPEERARARLPRPAPEGERVTFDPVELPPGVVGADRTGS